MSLARGLAGRGRAWKMVDRLNAGPRGPCLRTWPAWGGLTRIPNSSGTPCITNIFWFFRRKKPTSTVANSFFFKKKITRNNKNNHINSKNTYF